MDQRRPARHREDPLAGDRGVTHRVVLYDILYKIDEGAAMTALPISTVRQQLFSLVQQVNDDHDTVTVVTKSGENAVLVAESDWNSIQETLYVLATHGGVRLLESAREAQRGEIEARELLDPDA
ncbi:type II toxin-antitoxin system prevent-host-death family antitoxin [Nocardia nova]|uniref:Antitoxin n=1 Tax=Nocardia nova TaxID=37330 RepID=A0A2S5ZZG7_9NOCA|nr:type II toxin-antitoxin system prevent-host-death family antitoxin [Nocardia nova]